MLSAFKAIAIALIIVAGGTTSGCIIYREGPLPPITQWPPDVKQTKPTIRLIVTGQATHNGSVWEGSEDYFLEEWRRDTVRAYQHSGLFSEVRQTAVASDLQAEIRILHKTESSSVMSFIMGITLSLIPFTATETITVTTTLKDRNGATLKSLEKSERLRTWVELFLAFAMPFQSFDHLSIYDLNRATLIEAHSSKGLL